MKKLLTILSFVVLPAMLLSQVNYYLGMDVYSGTRFRDTMRIDSNAYFMNNVGIGTVSPTFNLHVAGTYGLESTVKAALTYQEGISSNVVGTGIKGKAGYYGESLTGQRVIWAIGDLQTIGLRDYDFVITRIDTANKFQNAFELVTNGNEVGISSTSTVAIQKSSIESFKDRVVIQALTSSDTLSFKTDSVFDFSATKGAIVVPRVLTANRPTAVNGMIIYNSTTNVFEFYENGVWVTK